jgi:hypothetical protein
MALVREGGDGQGGKLNGKFKVEFAEFCFNGFLKFEKDFCPSFNSCTSFVCTKANQN